MRISRHENQPISLLWAHSIFQVQDSELQDHDQTHDAEIRDQEWDSSSIIAISGCPSL